MRASGRHGVRGWVYRRYFPRPHSEQEANFVSYATFMETSFCFVGMQKACELKRIEHAGNRSKRGTDEPTSSPTVPPTMPPTV